MGFELLLANYTDSVEIEGGGERKGSREAVEAAVRQPRRPSWVQLSGFLYFLLLCLASLFDRLRFLPFEQP